MRLATFALLALLLAECSLSACPPRRARVVYAQPVVVYPAPVQPLVMAPPLPPGPVLSAKEPNPVLEKHLAEWEKKTASTVNLRAEISLKRTDVVSKKDREYTGVVLCMKPNYAVMRLDCAADKTDYEAFICDGKAVYAYSGKDKTVTEFPLPKTQPLDNAALGFFLNIDAKDMKERFDIELFKTDEHYIYLDIKPKRAADQREFTSARLALYAPGKQTAKRAYLPASVYLMKPNGDAETWKFTNPQINLEGVDKNVFQFVPIKGWKKNGVPIANGFGLTPEELERIESAPRP